MLRVRVARITEGPFDGRDSLEEAAESTSASMEDQLGSGREEFLENEESEPGKAVLASNGGFIGREIIIRGERFRGIDAAPK